MFFDNISHGQKHFNNIISCHIIMKYICIFILKIHYIINYIHGEIEILKPSK